MYINKVKILTDDEVSKLRKYNKGNRLKYENIPYKHVTINKIVANDKYNFSAIVFSCECGNLFSMSTSKLSYNLTYSDIDSINCGCIQIKEEENIIAEAKSLYYKKEQKSSINKHWCTYCESYRPEVKQKSKNTYNCKNCDFLINKKVVLGETFEEIMTRWNPTTHKADTKKIPYLVGNNKKGYKVKGFTYVSTDWYDEASKWLWVKAKHYIKTSFSKENLDRVGKAGCYKLLKDRKYKYMLLHRFIIGLGNDVNMVGDHINGFKLDNRSNNLRVTNSQQNSRNSIKRKVKCLSSFKGVTYVRSRESKKGKVNKVWKACLVVNGVTVLNRTFKSEIEAAQAYDNTLRDKYYSEYNKYNFPREGEISAI